MSDTADITAAWEGLVDTHSQRGDAFKAALVELRDLVLDKTVSRARLAESAVALYERAVKDAWAKPEDRVATPVSQGVKR